MDYKESLEYMFNQFPMFHRVGAAAYKANLDNTIALLNLLNNPQHKFKSIHVAGTNGKGSVSHYLAAIFQSAGYKTGLYTSPHLKDFRERIKINGEMIAEYNVCDFINKYYNDFSEIKPSFFEMTVGMAFQYFADEEVDIAIIETGLGGRLDSTNIINPELSVITNIGLDHTQFLGDTLEKIAMEKAGIIKPNTPVVIGETNFHTKNVFIDKAKKENASIVFADQKYKIKAFPFSDQNNKNFLYVLLTEIDTDTKSHLVSGLAGFYQLKNIITTLTAIDILKIKFNKITDVAIDRGFMNVVELTGLLGRWHCLSLNPLTICDTGHNVEGITEVLKHINTIRFKQLHFVLGMVNDKDIEAILKLLPKDAVYYFCKADIPRGLDQNILKEKAFETHLNGLAYDSVKDALNAAKNAANANDFIFIGGSTFVVAEVV